jgi:hypothetical protein
MTRKQGLLARLRDERAAWDQLLAAISERAMLTPKAIGDWSVKDVIAHVTSYERYIADRVWEMVRGEAYRGAETADDLAAFLSRFGYPDFGSPLLDDDEPNAWVVEHNRARPLPDIQAESKEAFDSLLDGLEQLPDAHFTERFAERIAGNTWEHYQHHRADLEMSGAVKGADHG